MRKKYASDISREKFEEIRPLLQSVRRRTKPTTVDLYEVFCAVLYIRAPRGKPPAKAEHRIRQKARFNHRRRPAGLK